MGGDGEARSDSANASARGLSRFDAHRFKSPAPSIGWKVAKRAGLRRSGTQHASTGRHASNLAFSACAKRASTSRSIRWSVESWISPGHVVRHSWCRSSRIRSVNLEPLQGSRPKFVDGQFPAPSLAKSQDEPNAMGSYLLDANFGTEQLVEHLIIDECPSARQRLWYRCVAPGTISRRVSHGILRWRSVHW